MNEMGMQMGKLMGMQMEWAIELINEFVWRETIMGIKIYTIDSEREYQKGFCCCKK